MRKKKEVHIAHHKFNNIQRRFVGFESFNAYTEAVAEGFLARVAAVRRQGEWDVPGAAVESYCPPHFPPPPNGLNCRSFAGEGLMEKNDYGTFIDGLKSGVGATVPPLTCASRLIIDE